MQRDQSPSGPPRYNLIVNDVPKFDLPSYIANYKGRTVLRRLYFIACCSPALRDEATRLVIRESKKGRDVRSLYNAIDLAKKNTHLKSDQSLLDTSWGVMQEKQNASETARLENELKGYKNNLIKESIRMGNEDLGSHYYSIGDLTNATKAYSRMREYCTTSTHIANTAFRIIAVAIEQKNWLAVQSQVVKIKNLQMKPEEASRMQPKTHAAMGLQEMGSGEYRAAARSFLSVDPSLTDTYNEILSSNDVATYGGLCALASMTRGELQARVLDNANFRNFLELEPHVRRAISFFCSSKYQQCLEILESYRADYQLDIYLQPHVNEIYKRVRTKSIVQYFQPFSKVTLQSMEKMFAAPTMINGTSTASGSATSSPSFRDELIGLIEQKKLLARIDLENGVLVAKESDARAEMQKEASEVIGNFVKEAQMKLIRLNAINAGLEVKAPLKKKGALGFADDMVGWADEDTSLGHWGNQGVQLTFGGGKGLRSGR